MQDEQAILSAVQYMLDVKLQSAAAVALAGRSQGGSRDGVVGGKHLAGINRLLVDELRRRGLPNVEFRTDRRATLPGYFRSSKAWDLLVLSMGIPVLAVEYKSMMGSEGNNLNNRSDEVMGVGLDLMEAQRRELVHPDMRRAYVFIMEATPAATHPVGTSVAVGEVDPVFAHASYLERMAIMCRRLRETQLYDLTWALGFTREPLALIEPDPKVGWKRFKHDLLGVFDALESP